MRIAIAATDRRAVVQVTRQFLPGFFLHLDDAVALVGQVLIQTRILDGDHRLLAKDIQDLPPVGCEITGIGMTEDQHAVDAEPAPQRETIYLATYPQGDDTVQFRILSHLRDENRIAIFDSPGKRAICAR